MTDADIESIIENEAENNPYIKNIVFRKVGNDLYVSVLSVGGVGIEIPIRNSHNNTSKENFSTNKSVEIDFKYITQRLSGRCMFWGYTDINLERSLAFFHNLIDISHSLNVLQIECLFTEIGLQPDFARELAVYYKLFPQVLEESLQIVIQHGDKQ